MEVGVSRPRRWLWLILGVAFLVCAILGVVFYAMARPKPIMQLPSSVQEHIVFPVYLPTYLPDGYAFVANSFNVSEGILIFKAQDKSGKVIAFTEQQKPQNFDFAGFYAAQLSDTKTVANAPFPSTVGKGIEGSTMVLSVVTDKTWLLVSSGALLADDDLQRIARSMRVNQ